jgi:hypothetical protein
MRRPLLALALAIGAVTLGAVDVRADLITGRLWINQPGPSGNALLGFGDPNSPTYLGTPDATFTSGAFNYNSNVGGYTVGGFLNNPTFNNPSAAFTAAGGGGANLNNTYFYFTGTIFLNAGVNSFVVGHDDGLQLNIDGIGLVVNTPGPTSFVNTPFNVTAPSTGTYNFEMSYGETFGPPAQLLFSINGGIIGTTAPEPATLTMLGIGLGCLGVRAWQRRAAR